MTDPRTVLGPDTTGRTVVLAGEHVIEVRDGTESQSEPQVRSDLHIDCDGARIASGAVNAHTHVYSGLAPLGMPAPSSRPESFPQILERIWWCLDRALDRATLRSSARYYMAHALLSGTTTLIDHHESPDMIDGSLDVLAEVAADLGIRVVLGYGATERNAGREEARAGLAECHRLITSGMPSTIRGLVALHASFTVSDETIRDAGNMCRDLGVVLHTHLAEARDDVLDAAARGFDGPWERLVQLDAVPAGSILAHGVHLPASAVDEISARSCWIVQNPRSNEGNQVGYPETIDRSAQVALGTDGYPADMIEETRHLDRIVTARHGDPVTQARIDGSRALVSELFEEDFDLRSGAVADVVVRDDRGVREVFVAGRQVVHDGRLVTGEIEEIDSEARVQASQLWTRMLRFQNGTGD